MRIHEILQTKSNCVPVALQRVTDASDEEIESVCAKHRWTERQGMNIGQIIGALKSLGYTYKSRNDLVFYKAERDGQRFNIARTLNQLLKIIPMGRFLVSVRGHTIAIVDGKIYDDASFGLKHKVNDVIEVFPSN
ncbi:MAG: hypothetical protein HC836_47535 [Richelia sp. RM2_1_2]|nr:hypothetical protein [Richelia sp. RM2_1_2]